MRDSKFVLCPRGIATSSYRCYEAMALGRVPVILSDAWVPPAGPDWGEFALIVAEDRIADLPDILRAHEPHWRAMGRAARAAWEEWFAPEIITYRVLRSIEAILLTRGANHDERTYQEEWTRWRFAYASGWTLPQRAYAALRSGRVADKMRALGRREWTDREHQKKESRA